MYDSIVSLLFCELPCPFLLGFIFRNNNKNFFNKNILLSHVPINDRTNPDWLAHHVDVQQQHDVAGAWLDEITVMILPSFTDTDTL